MLDLNILSISLYQIQIFLSVAEYNSFTKAAEKMHITQPVVSKNIASIERTLGLQLFVREKRTVRLTPAGKLLYENWNALGSMIEQTVTRAHHLQMGSLGHLTVGIHNVYEVNLFLLPIIRRFKKKYPNVVLQIKANTFRDLRKRLLSEEVDVAFTSKFEGDDIIENNSLQFRARIVMEFPLVAYMLDTNPLAQRESISVSDLRNQKFIVHSPVLVPTYMRLINDMCAQHGTIHARIGTVIRPLSFLEF